MEVTRSDEEDGFESLITHQYSDLPASASSSMMADVDATPASSSSAVPPLPSSSAMRTSFNYEPSRAPFTPAYNPSATQDLTEVVQQLRTQVQSLLHQLWFESQKYQRTIYELQEQNQRLESQLLRAEQREQALYLDLRRTENQMYLRTDADQDLHGRLTINAGSSAPLSVGPFVAGASGRPSMSLGHPLIQERDQEVEALRQELLATQFQLQRERHAGLRRDTVQTMQGGAGEILGGMDTRRAFEHLERLSAEKAAMQHKYEAMKRRAIRKTRELMQENERLKVQGR